MIPFIGLFNRLKFFVLPNFDDFPISLSCVSEFTWRFSFFRWWGKGSEVIIKSINAIDVDNVVACIERVSIIGYFFLPHSPSRVNRLLCSSIY